MNYLPLDFPPGMFSNGTIYQNQGRWYRGDRVRWRNGKVVPIGGWQDFFTDFGKLDQVLTSPSQIARALKVYRRPDGSIVYVVGHNEGLKAFANSSTSVSDLTPDGFISAPSGINQNVGYGGWYYGVDVYGTERQGDEILNPIFNWCFRVLGKRLLAAPRGAPSKLYKWDSDLDVKADAVANAPDDFDCFHITEQQIVVVAGSPEDPRLIQWSASENNEDWTPMITNQAGFQRVPGSGRFKEIVSYRDQYLLIGETDLHTMRYLGPPYVHGFDQLAENCGTFAGAAVVATDDFVVWPGEQEFYIYDGTLSRLDCPSGLSDDTLVLSGFSQRVPTI